MKWHYLNSDKTNSFNLISDAIDDPNVSYTTAVVEADDSGSEQVPVESVEMIGQHHVALVTQEDGTQQQVMEYEWYIPRITMKLILDRYFEEKTSKLNMTVLFSII